jgi:hypothetical protein
MPVVCWRRPGTRLPPAQLLPLLPPARLLLPLLPPARLLLPLLPPARLLLLLTPSNGQRLADVCAQELAPVLSHVLDN